MLLTGVAIAKGTEPYCITLSIGKKLKLICLVSQSKHYSKKDIGFY